MKSQCCYVDADSYSLWEQLHWKGVVLSNPRFPHFGSCHASVRYEQARPNFVSHLRVLELETQIESTNESIG